MILRIWSDAGSQRRRSHPDAPATLAALLLSDCSRRFAVLFERGRSAILPESPPGRTHTANALTQTTGWLTLSIGTNARGISAMQFGYEMAFLLNAASFSGERIADIVCGDLPEGHFPARANPHRKGARAFGRDFADSLRYMRREPLIMAIDLRAWAGLPAAGRRRSSSPLFGEVVYNRGPVGIGMIWGARPG